MHKNENDISARMRAAQGLIWDLDNTLYHLDKVLYDACNHAAALAAIHLGAPLTIEKAVEISWQSFEDTGMSGTYFIEKYGISKQAMHDEYHRCIDVKLINQTEGLAHIFGDLELPHSIVTHASKEWAQNVLTHLGLAAFFPDSYIIAHETTDFAHKAHSQKPFEMALDIMNLQAENVLVVEDLTDNLRIPYDMGSMTVLIHHKRPPETIPGHIHMAYNNAYEFMKSMLDARS